MPKRNKNLTVKEVENLEVEGKKTKDFSDGMIPGFGIRVSGRTGRKTWNVQYKVNGTNRRLKLGTFPTTSLSKARERAREVRRQVEAGEDPAQDRDDRREGKNTFGALAREVLDAKATKTRESTSRERERMYKKDLKPAWGETLAKDISRRDVVKLVEGIAARGAPASANRTLSLIKMIFNEGLRRGFPGLEANPAHMVQDPGEEGGRSRYLTRKEIKKVWEALEPEGIITASIFRLALLTAQRSGAVRALRFDQVDGADVWTIPADVFKGKRKHMVPLSPEALELLEEVRPASVDGWAFPGRSDGSEPHVVSINSALRRVRARTEEMGVPHWTVHDFRTTFRTHASRPENPDHEKDPAGLGIRPEIADAVLGHKEQSVGARHYQAEPWRYRLAEKREALKRWGRFVMEAVEGEDA